MRPTPGPARNLQELNTSRLAPGVTITNNVLVRNGAGGIDLSGDNPAAGQRPALCPLDAS